jgi:hypothetical protein
MIMAEINVNIVEKTIKANRTPLSMIGGNLFGQDVFSPQTRTYNPDYEKIIDQVKSGGNADLCLNRSPRRFNIFATTVSDMRVKENIAGEVVLKINPDTDREIEIPASTLGSFGKTTEEAVREAMKNPEKKMVFSDPKKLNEFLNALNRAEIARLDKIISECEKAKSQCVSTISRNEASVAAYFDEKTSSKPAADVSVSVHIDA